MEWPEDIELTLDGMAQGGEAVGRYENRVVFASGGLPGEQVRVRLQERKDSYARGDVTEVLQAAPERVAPRDPEADHMGWQFIDHSAQLVFKRQILADQLAKIGGLPDVPVHETLAVSPPWGYRSSARLHVQASQIGYHAAGSRELRPFTGDPLLVPALNEAVLALAGLIDEGDAIDSVSLRANQSGETVVASFHGKGDIRTLAHRWTTRAPQVVGVATPAGDVGSAELREELGGITFLLRPESFFQVNLAAATALLRLISGGLQLDPEERLLDLYCGVGTFTLPLARQASSVRGIEEFPQAVRDAERTAAANNLENTKFFAGPVERVLKGYNSRIDALVMDPPRRGCHPRALEEVLRLAPRKLVYVSCHPGTLARDLKLLVAGGYRVREVTPVDLFPQTPHIESVSVLERVAGLE